jgi:hypothetical protein
MLTYAHDNPSRDKLREELLRVEMDYAKNLREEKVAEDRGARGSEKLLAEKSS